MKKILVTGGAGFIGGNYIHHRLRHHSKDTIICVDKLTYAGNMETLAPVLDGICFERADIADSNAIDSVFAKHRPEVVINFAAESHVDRSIEHPGVFLLTNVIGTQVLLDASRKHGVSCFHQVSTDEVYGDLPLDRPDLMFTEETPLHTSSPYSASKAGADLLCLAYHRTYGMPITISRCSNNYGPYQFPEKLIPLMLANAAQDKRLPVYGEGVNVRDWLYVEDHCRAIDMIVDSDMYGEVYNIGGNNERRNIDVVKAILAQLGKPESLIEYVADRPGHDLRYAIDPAKMGRVFGWAPETAFEDGLALTIKWYGENRQWLENILSGKYRDANCKVWGS